MPKSRRIRSDQESVERPHDPDGGTQYERGVGHLRPDLRAAAWRHAGRRQLCRSLEESDLIKKVSSGRTILMVEHNMSVVSGICDRISVLQRGAMLAEGSYAEVSKNPI